MLIVGTYTLGIMVIRELEAVFLMPTARTL